ncbi:MAG: DUF3078 domain-containing protein [Clostridium sp.]|nr:DUF3078 domain-containing protein [Clostridium sp.]
MLRKLLTSTIIITACAAGFAQAMFFDNAKVPDSQDAEQSLGAKLNSVISGSYTPSQTADEEAMPDTIVYASLADSLIACFDAPQQLMSLAPLPAIMYLPAIFNRYELPDTASIYTPDYSGIESLAWIEDLQASYGRYNQAMRDMASRYPWAMRYNRRLLPDPPKELVVSEANPQDFKLNVSSEATNVNNATTLIAEEVNRKHWIKDFRASLQFMQAYNSPNWYQGGNNNVNALFNVYYNVKLNPAFHPKLLFETTFQYKLGLNSAPDDSLHNYNISDDLLQINTLLGIKAIEKWYYSVTGQFKTQLFNAYRTNSQALRSAFMSPAELNLALGMTYSSTNRKKTLAFDANVSPLSYNMTICTNRRMDETAYGIAPDHKVLHKFGSKLEFNLNWKLTYNISLRSRLFGFTDYDRTYFDWENTLLFEINKYITTQLFLHMRYDSDTPKVEDQNWHKLQLKEILSLGFAYRFATI